MENEEQKAIRITREEVKATLKETINTLKEVREKFRINRLWNLGGDSKELEEIIERLERLEDSLAFPTPDRGPE